MAEERWKGALIGLGQMAWKYDGGRASDPEDPRTHASAYGARGDGILAGGCSPDPREREMFARALDLPVFETPEDLLRVVRPRVVSICSPTSFHTSHVMCCLEAGVPLIWLEKPPAASLAELDALRREARGRARVLVHYHRRYAPFFRLLRREIRRGSLGPFRGGEVVYSRGLASNGIHFVDLVLFLWDVAGVPEISFRHVSAFGEDYPTFALVVGGGEILFRGVDVPGHLFEGSFSFDDARVRFADGGERGGVEMRRENPRYPGFFHYHPEASPLDGAGLRGCLAAALEDLFAAFREGRDPESNLDTSWGAEAVVEALRGGKTR